MTTQKEAMKQAWGEALENQKKTASNSNETV
jgi:hypothetical protein